MFQVCLWFGLGLYFCFVFTTSASAIELISGPYLQRVSYNTVTIVWETREAVIGTVEYGENELGRAVSDALPARIHRIQLTGLRPNTRYAYRCRWEDRITETFTFRTPPPRGTQTFRIAAVGASFGSNEIGEEIARRIAYEHPELVLHTGGKVENPADAEEWRTQFFRPFSALINRVPLFPIWGHSGPPTDVFRDYFHFPEDRSYWSLEYANALIIGLDSNDSGAPDTEQSIWLEQTLSSNRLRWAVVILHEPLFSAHPQNPSSETRWEWQRLFQEYNVDLVLSGRDRFYHRTDPIGYVTNPQQKQSGVVHINTGGGGAPLQPSVVMPYTRKRNHVNHFLILDFEHDRLVGRAIDVSGEGFDAFVIDKRSVQGPEEFISFEMIELERELHNWARTRNQRTVTGPDMIDLPLRANISTRFRVPIQGEVALLDIASKDANQSSWDVTPRSGSKSIWLSPGEPLSFDFKTYRPPGLSNYPLPRLQVKLRYNHLISDFLRPLRGFRNHTLIVPAMQVFENLVLDIPRSARPLVEDNEFTSEILRQYDPQQFMRYFYLDQTASLPVNSTTVRLLHDSNYLFINATMFLNEEAPLGMTSLYHGRNSELLLNNEYICVNIYRDDAVYTFLLCSNGQKYEALNFDELRETEWLSSAELLRNAWTANIAIPFSSFGGAQGDWKIDILRYDRFANELSTIKPSFGMPRHWPICAVDVSLK